MSKGLESFNRLMGKGCSNEDIDYIVKDLKALDILIKWYQPYIIHDLCCFGASDEEISLVREVLK